MILPGFNVIGISPKTRAKNYSSVYDRYALPDLINWLNSLSSIPNVLRVLCKSLATRALAASVQFDIAEVRSVRLAEVMLELLCLISPTNFFTAILSNLRSDIILLNSGLFKSLSILLSFAKY